MTQTTAFIAPQNCYRSRKNLPKRPPPLVDEDGFTFVCRSWKTYYYILATLSSPSKQPPSPFTNTDSLTSLSSEETAVNWADEVPLELVEGAKTFKYDLSALKPRKQGYQKKKVTWANLD
jgi:hypothetical protein